MKISNWLAKHPNVAGIAAAVYISAATFMMAHTPPLWTEASGDLFDAIAGVVALSIGISFGLLLRAALKKSTTRSQESA
jgi:uncharacterized membrane protein